MGKNPCKVITGPETMLSYLNCFEPKAMMPGAPEKFSVSAIIPKSDTKTLKKIEAAIQAAYEEGQSKLKGNSKSVPPLSSLKTPLRDGDTDRPDDPAYANSYFVNANSSSAPEVVDADCNPIINRADAYSGCKGRVSITFYAYNINGGARGIAAGLGNIQVLEKGTPFGSRSSAEDDFSNDDDDDDFLD